MKKTSRTFKRFAAITSASLLAACMVAPMSMNITASAVNITIKDAEVDSEYAGYKLLSAEQDGTTITYEVPDKYLAILQSVTGKSTKADIIAYIGAIADDSTAARDFADAVYMKILAASPAITPEETTTGTTAMDAEQGYYLIAETKTGTTGDTVSDDSFSLVILNTAGASGLEVTTKENEPTLEKKVQDIYDLDDKDITDNDWDDSADHDFGDQVPFQLTGTVSAKYANYNEYYYSFHDTLSKGLTLKKDSLKVMIGTFDATSCFKIVRETKGEDGSTTFEVMCPDLKAIKDGENSVVTASSKIVVEYTAELNTDAVLGEQGNPNKAYLEYSTNPYFTGDGATSTDKDEDEDTGNTPEDKVIVFTYQTIINKVDQSGDPLEGAEFELYKATAYDADAAEGTDPYTWAPTSITLANDSTETVFKFKGLDDGVYKLVESETPKNYNSIDPIIFTITATHDKEADDPKLLTFNGNASSGSVTFDKATGSLTADVVNNYGSSLPSTGGIGTTVFYLGGGAMVAVAGIYLISKKRMKNTQE